MCIRDSYNTISSNGTITTANTKNSVLFGPITVSGGSTVLTIDGNGALSII